MQLPTPSPDALAHQKKLLEYLASVYQQHGPLSFADFMQIALYAPGLGYYSAGAQKFGKDGDFVTAPEISPLFSKCLGAQCAQILASLNDPQACILELGAGSGVMACDLILMLSTLKQLPKYYYILEVSAELKARQQALLKQRCPEFFANIIWLDSLPKEPLIGIILGNEVIDAMPVHLFRVAPNGDILEGVVHLNSQQWQCYFDTPVTNHLAARVHELNLSLAPGYTSEINLALQAWTDALQKSLAQGVMIFIDYGFARHEYYHPARSMGTLMCHYRHHAHSDPMLYIGLQDITAHVDFTALAFAGVNCGLHVAGFTNQAAFLISNGLLDLANTPQSNTAQIAYSQQIQQLTHPHEMGELFKVIAFVKNYTDVLQGFQLSDQRHRL